MSGKDLNVPARDGETPVAYAQRLERAGMEEMEIRKALRGTFHLKLDDTVRVSSKLDVARLRHVALLKEIAPDRTRFSLVRKIARNLNVTDEAAAQLLARYEEWSGRSEPDDGSDR